MNLIWIPIIGLMMSPAIAYMDMMVFAKGKGDWKNWLPATFLELSLFMCGMVVGKLAL